ncbi:hypothetical protein [Hymenobacter coccineus]|uniref:Mandelate racemase/muconate lactonizing enzyme N-terminal domain-containing protein n=1 Tax=Hymenobacter coccineus TaxID=1908235 RepID=A0A1G1TFM0_9BACT|nr:hypothetical protein [Hymenobacter coccineus]OGX89682.1 hypothetical protein BEN49_08750 [Hymenobacter coccineus]
MPTWTLTALDLPLRFVWKISRNASAAKTNLVVQVAGHGHTGRGEAAPNVRYAESPALLAEQFGALQAAGLARVETLDDLDALLGAHPVAQALSFALEAALVQWLAGRAGSQCGSGWACRRRPPPRPPPSRCPLCRPAKWPRSWRRSGRRALSC